MKYLTLLALILSSSAYAGTCAGPAPCDYVPGPCFGPACVPVEPVEPTGPAELCLPEGCSPVTYRWLDRFMTATSFLPNGYPVIGWSGACDAEVCPDIKNQAFSNLEWNAKVANRAQRY